jgi:AraC-like DNA-binding protein
MQNSPERWTKVEVEHQVRPEGLTRTDLVHSATILSLVKTGRMEATWQNGHASIGRGKWLWWASLSRAGERFPLETKLLTVRLRIGAWAAQAEADREAVSLIRQIDAYTQTHGPVLPLTNVTRSRLAEQADAMAGVWRQPTLAHHCCALKAGAMQMLSLLASDPTFGPRLLETQPGPTQSTAARKIAEALYLLSRREFVQRRDLTVGHLAMACGYGVSRFHTLFLEATGTTPNRYLAERRVTLACELLGKPHRNVLDVALTCGFGTQSRFYAAFHEVTGQTPGQYRRERKR